jgi:hypothetical protein
VLVNPRSNVRPAGQRRVSRTGLLASAGAVLVLAGHALSPRPVAGAATVVDTDEFSLAVGMRLQPRVVVARGLSPLGANEWQRDFLVRRSRLKLSGDVMSVLYSFEWRLDGTGLNSGIAEPAPISGLENGWIEWPLAGPEFAVRAGLYDSPNSRDRLTSDSRQLVVDRGLVSDVPNAFGLVDNAIGFDVRGKVNGGRFMYAVGAFDNRTIPAPLQNGSPMFVGRVDVNLGSTKDVYQDAHFGDDSWYSVAANFNFQGSLEDTSGAKDGQNSLFGVDGMVDVPAGPGRLFGRAEFNSMAREAPGSGNSIRTNIWMAGAGYLVWNQRLQPTLRFDQVLEDDKVGGRKRNHTFLGLNYYKQGHGLKLQGDLLFASGTGDEVDGGRVQAQVDF